MASPETSIAVTHPWERQEKETDRAFEAFEEFRKLGLGRTFVKVAERLQKSETIIRRWAVRDNWKPRVLAYDRHEARVVNERVLLGTAGMRERMTVLAQQMQSKAQNRLLKMTEAELQKMKPTDVVSLMRAAADMERSARDISEEEMDTILPEFVPKFEVQIIQPGKHMVGVQMGDGRYGYIPEGEIDRFRRDHPAAVVIA